MKKKWKGDIVQDIIYTRDRQRRRSWRTSVLLSSAPAVIKHTCLYLSWSWWHWLASSVCLIRVGAKRCRTDVAYPWSTLLYGVTFESWLKERRNNWILSRISFLVWLSTEAVAFFSLSRPPLFSSLLASSVSSHIYWRDSLCTALQTGKLWIWSTSLSARLIPSSQGEVWVLGNPFVPTGRSRPDLRGMRGRGGKSCVWRLFPWRTLKISTFSAPW